VDLQKLILYMYYLNICFFVSGLYLIVVYCLLGDSAHAAKESASTAFNLAVILFFRKRFP
jgi:hypothetical protein